VEMVSSVSECLTEVDREVPGAREIRRRPARPARSQQLLQARLKWLRLCQEQPREI